MANWAIVIGINEYWTPSARLTGAINDAINMVEWLTDAKGGNVPLRNLFFMSRPTPQAVLSADIEQYDATWENLVRVINRLVTKSGRKGERLFFYFSGHGLTNHENFSDEQAIIMADFEDMFPNKAALLRSIYEFFQATQFKEQFFIIDACRNMLNWKNEFHTGPLPKVAQADAQQQPPVQYRLFATSPKLRAVDLGEKGAFTEVLLKGLRGSGKAKIYLKDSDEYAISVDRLFNYVESEVLKKALNVSEDPNQPIFQKPDIEIKGNIVGEICRLSPQQVDLVKLSISVAPAAAWPIAEIVIIDETSDEIKKVSALTKSPIEIDNLLPKGYFLKVTAPKFIPKRKRWFVELYENSAEPLALVLDPDVSRTNNPLLMVQTLTFDAGASLTDLIDIEKAVLKVKVHDPLAIVEIADSNNKIIKGEKHIPDQSDKEIDVLIFDNLEPGIYRVRMITPGGNNVETVVDLLPGEFEEITMMAPPLVNTNLVKQVIEKAKFVINEEANTLEVSNKAKSIATPHLSTILTLAGAAINTTDQDWGDRLRSLGLKSFKEMTHNSGNTGVQIIAATESITADKVDNYFANVKLRLWKFDEAVSMEQRFSPWTEIPRLAEFSTIGASGPQWLSIELPDQPPVLFNLTILKDRITMLIIHQQLNRQIRVFKYTPALENPQTMDPTQVRRLELLQRFYMYDRIKNACSLAEDLLMAKWVEPIAGCIGGYMMLKLGKTDLLDIAINNMTNFFGEMSDSHILAAEYHLNQGREDQACMAYLEALNKGLPIFAQGVELLYQAVKKYALEHPRKKLLEQVYDNRINGLLWSAWRPPLKDNAKSLQTGINLDEQLMP